MAVRMDDYKYTFLAQPYGWPGEKLTLDMPILTNLRWDPFERFSMLRGESAINGAWGYPMDFFAREFWRFVVVQKAVFDLAETAINYPSMQDPASFNLEAVKKQIQAMMKQHEGQ